MAARVSTYRIRIAADVDASGEIVTLAVESREIVTHDDATGACGAVLSASVAPIDPATLSAALGPIVLSQAALAAAALAAAE